MKTKAFLIVFAWLMAGTAFGQHVITYQSYMQGSDSHDTTFTQVLENRGQLKIVSLNNEVKHPIPGYAETVTCVDYGMDSVFSLLQYPDERYYSAYPLSDNDVVFSREGEEKVLGYPCTKYKTSINSNTIEVWMTEKPGFNATSMPQLGRLEGVMVRCMRNGSYVTDLKMVKKDRSIKDLIPADKGQRMTSRELSHMKLYSQITKKPKLFY